MEKIRFGIVGCGYQTTKNMAPAMSQSDSAYAVGFYDPERHRAESLSSKYGGTPYASLVELLADEKVEAVYIATPNVYHKEICIAAASMKKHVLCEKSLAIDPREAEEMKEACEINGVVLREGFMYEHHSQHGFVREMVAQGEIGDPLVFSAWFGFPMFPVTDFRTKKDLGGGIILDAAAYTVHAARKFFAREPVDCHSCISKSKNGLDIHGAALLDFGQGQCAQLAFGMNNSYKNSYSVWGSNGEIRLRRAFSIPAAETPVCTIINQGIVREYSLSPCNHFTAELDDFAGAIRQRGKDYNEILLQAKALDMLRGQSKQLY